MAHYIQWETSERLPFDAWLRVHARLGAEMIGVCPNAMRIPGTIAEWEAWTGLHFPETAEYIVPGALNPEAIDVDQNLGIYVEPNVWMLHRIE